MFLENRSNIKKVKISIISLCLGIICNTPLKVKCRICTADLFSNVGENDSSSLYIMSYIYWEKKNGILKSVSNKSELTCIPDSCLGNKIGCSLSRIHLFVLGCCFSPSMTISVHKWTNTWCCLISVAVASQWTLDAVWVTSHLWIEVWFDA